MTGQVSKVRSQNYNSNLKSEYCSVNEESDFSYRTGKAEEDLAWKRDLRKRSYRFAVDVVKFVDTLETRGVQYSIKDQLVRTATSVGANLVEARAASSKRDFIRYYEIALKSANETQFWLCLLRDAMGTDRSGIKPLPDEAVELSNMIGASVLTLKNKK